MKKTLSIGLSLLLVFCIFSSFSCSFKKPPKKLTATTNLENISKFGNVTISIENKELLDSGYNYGDILNVSFLNQSLNLPLCSDYSDIDVGSTGIFARKDDTNISLAMNLGDFATNYGIATKESFEDETFKWTYCNGVDESLKFKIKMEKPAGYYNEYMAHKLSYTNNREDYPELSDAQFANFRMITTTGIGTGTLYRTSSPIDPQKGRNTYADAELKKANVNYVLNLGDSDESEKNYPGFSDTYYSKTKHEALDMGMNFKDEDFKIKLAEGLRFLTNNEGIYAINCVEGKDRTGFFVAVLECLMGANVNEVIDDYMQTFCNYYKINKDDPKYNIIAESNIKKTLKAIFPQADIDKDLSTPAYNYIKDLGLTDDEINHLKSNLAKQH